MIWLVQLLLAAAGVWAVLARGIHVGSRVVRRPHTVYAGLILVLQLPVGALCGFALGVAEGVKAYESGVVPERKRVQKRAVYFDAAVTGGAVLLAAAVGAAGMRAERPAYVGGETIKGVRDVAAERERRRAAQERAAEEWRGERDPADSG